LRLHTVGIADNMAVISYPFTCIALFLRFALDLEDRRVTEPAAACEAMLSPRQQLLPEPIRRALETAIATPSRETLLTVRAVATRHGYL